MKQTPFFEIAVALKDRPLFFRLLVIGCLAFSMLIFMVGASRLLYPAERIKNMPLTAKQSKNERAGMTASFAVKK